MIDLKHFLQALKDLLEQSNNMAPYQLLDPLLFLQTRVLGLGDSQALYGDAGFFDSVIITDINANYRFSDQLSFFAAVNNVNDEEPYATQSAWPVGPRGRTLILGLSYSM